MDSRKTRENARAKRLEELTKEFLGEATATAQSGEDYSEVLRMLKEKHPSSFVDSFIKKVEEAQKRADGKPMYGTGAAIYKPQTEGATPLDFEAWVKKMNELEI